VIGAASWLGEVDNIIVKRGNQPKLKAKMANRNADCSLVVQKGESGDVVFCGPTPTGWLMPDLLAEQSQSAAVVLPGSCLGDTLADGGSCADGIANICARLAAPTCAPLRDRAMIGEPT